MMGDNQQVLDALKELHSLPGNNSCADCKTEESTWASVTLGVFVCNVCCKYHRAMGVSISQVMNLNSNEWTMELVQVMKRMGNLRANRRYEAHIPLYYKKPTSSDPSVLKEQWVRAKYQRLEFVSEKNDNRPYERSYLEGYLWKQGKENGRFELRRFVLSERENTLAYYNKERAKTPKATIPIDTLNMAFVPEKIGNNNGIQLTYETSDGTRNLFVYAEAGEEVVMWYNAIRSAKLKRRRLAFPLPEVTDEELAAELTTDFAIEGWVHKTGPRASDGWRRRWMSLEGRKLLYFNDKLAAFAKGEIMIGYKDDGYGLSEGVPSDRTPLHESFTLRTPLRAYHFSCESAAEKAAWWSAISKLLEQPLTPQECSKMRLTRK